MLRQQNGDIVSIQSGAHDDIFVGINPVDAIFQKIYGDTIGPNNAALLSGGIGYNFRGIRAIQPGSTN